MKAHLRSRLAFSLACSLFVLLSIAACGDDGGSASSPADAAVSQDGSGSGADAAAVTPDASASIDAAQTSFEPVDCRQTSDCLGISTCNPSAPGGVCIGCGGAGDCNLDSECVAQGACAHQCTDDSDCNPGKRCSTGLGVCVIRSCSSASLCPEPYVCSDPSGGLCQRPACDGTSCPAPFVCDTDSQLCVEPT